MLNKQDPPNDGVLTAIGGLGIDVEGNSGFDIGGRTNNAYGLFTVNGSNRIYRIDISTGKASKFSEFPITANALAIGLGF